MRENISRLGAVIFALVMTVSIMAPAGAGLADTQEGPEIELTDSPAPIHSSLQGVEGTETVVLRLQEVNDRTIQTQGLSGLQAHAQASQQQVKFFAKQTQGVEIVNSFWITNAVVAKVNTNQVNLETLARLQNVEELHANLKVELPERVQTDSDVSTDDVGSQAVDTTYGLDQVNAPEVWEEFGTRGEGAKVAVLDTGVDPDHPDIDIRESNFEAWDRFGNPTGERARDSGSHGTHVSGTVVGGDASGEYIGVAPDATLLHGLVLDGGRGSFSTIIAGMEWAVDNDADIISMSLGGAGYSDAYIEPVRNAKNAGTAVIVAAGNSGEGSSGSPGNVYDSLAIGATNSQEQVTRFSSGEEINTQRAWGSAAPADWPDQYIVPDVSAPGGRVKSAVPGGRYSEKSGTSMATPHVSGVAALMVSAAGGDLSPEQIEQTLIDTSFKPSNAPDRQDNRWGYGITDALAAVREVADTGSSSFEITGADAPSEVTPGASIAPSVTVENTGSQTGSTDVTFTFEGQQLGSQQVSLAPGQSQTVTFNAEAPTQEGTYDWVVDTGDDSLSAQLEVVEESSGSATFDIVDASPPGEVSPGEAIAPSVVVENTGNEAGSTSVAFVFEGQEVASKSVSLAPGESQTVTFEANAPDQPGTYDWQVTTGDDSISAQLEVVEDTVDTNFAIVDAAPPGEVTPGEAIAPSVVVENTGSDAGSTSVAFVFEGQEVASKSVSLGPGESQTVTFEANAPDQPGTYDWQVTTGDDSISAQLEVVEESSGPEFVIEAVDAPSEGEAGATAEGQLRLANVGDEAGETTVTLTFAGTTKSGSFSLGAGESQVISFTLTLPEREGSYTWTLETADDSVSGTVSVVEPELPPVVGRNSPNDLDNDGLYEDVTGDGVFNYDDVQALYYNLNSPAVQNYPAAYNFAGDRNPTAVRYADVQALYDYLVRISSDERVSTTGSSSGGVSLAG